MALGSISGLKSLQYTSNSPKCVKKTLPDPLHELSEADPHSLVNLNVALILATKQSYPNKHHIVGLGSFSRQPREAALCSSLLYVLQSTTYEHKDEGDKSLKISQRQVKLKCLSPEHGQLHK